MPKYEYKVVPAPKKGLKGKGVKGSEERFAHALTVAMNGLGVEGWDYLRCDTLPCKERSGLTGKTTVYQNMLVFRREILMEDGAEALADEEAANDKPAERVVETIAETHAPLLETSGFENSRKEPVLSATKSGDQDIKADEVAAE